MTDEKSGMDAPDNVVSLARGRAPRMAPVDAPLVHEVLPLAPASEPPPRRSHAEAVRTAVSLLLEAGKSVLVVFNVDFPGAVFPSFAPMHGTDGPVRTLALRFERWGGYSPQVHEDRLEEVLGFRGQHVLCVVPFAAVLAVQEA